MIRKEGYFSHVIDQSSQPSRGDDSRLKKQKKKAARMAEAKLADPRDPRSEENAPAWPRPPALRPPWLQKQRQLTYDQSLRRDARLAARRAAFYAEIERIYGDGRDGESLREEISAKAKTRARSARRDKRQIQKLVDGFAKRREVDTIALLFRRRQIDRRQMRAAETYRAAWQVCRGSIPCALASSGPRGAGSRSPTQTQLEAAETLADAARVLGLADSRLVGCIVCEGWSIQDASERIFGSSRADREHAGRRLREALNALADAWWPAAREKIRTARAPDAVPTRSTTDRIEPSPGAHASRRGVYRI